MAIGEQEPTTESARDSPRVKHVTPSSRWMGGEERDQHSRYVPDSRELEAMTATRRDDARVNDAHHLGTR